ERLRAKRNLVLRTGNAVGRVRFGPPPSGAETAVVGQVADRIGVFHRGVGFAAADVLGHGDGVGEAVDDVAGGRPDVASDALGIRPGTGNRAGRRTAGGLQREGARRAGVDFVAQLLSYRVIDVDVDIRNRHVVAVAVAERVAAAGGTQWVRRAQVLGNHVL